MKRIFLILFQLLVLSSCVSAQQLEEDEPVILPSETSPSDTPNVESPAFKIPSGKPPLIDGNLSPGEWDSAQQATMTNGTPLYLMHADGFLFVGIKGSELSAVDISILRGKEIWVLHSSAALASAIYEPIGETWDLAQDFNFCCRETSNFEENSTLFDKEGWQANIGYLGEEGHVEYQIKVETKEAFFAISNMTVNDSLEYWPDSLSANSVDALSGSRNETETFFIDEWVRLTWE